MAMMTKNKHRLIGLITIFLSGAVSAQGLGPTIVPNVFQPSEPALSSEVNENFAVLDQAVVTLIDDVAIRTVVVSPVPGDPVASGDALRNELAGIESPATDNRYLLIIEPGDYDLGNGGLTTRSYVDIEGSGPGMTTLHLADSSITLVDAVEIRGLSVEATYGSGGGNAFLSTTVSNVSLRDMSITATATGASVSAVIGVASGSSFQIRNVDINVSGGIASNAVSSATGLFFDIRNSSITSSGASSFNRPIALNNSSLMMVDVTATATGVGARALQTNGPASVFNSRLVSDADAIIVDTTGSVGAANTQIVGAYADPDITVVGCYDASFAPIADTL